MCQCDKVWIEEVVFGERGWNYLPTHTKCGQKISEYQAIELLYRYWLDHRPPSRRTVAR